MAKDRAALLVELIRENEAASADLFDLLVPTYQTQLYSLYCVLKKSDVLEDCTFNDAPEVEDGMLTIHLGLPKSGRKKCTKYIESIDNRAEYLKKSHFNLVLSESSSTLSIRFDPV